MSPFIQQLQNKPKLKVSCFPHDRLTAPLRAEPHFGLKVTSSLCRLKSFLFLTPCITTVTYSFILFHYFRLEEHAYKTI